MEKDFLFIFTPVFEFPITSECWDSACIKNKGTKWIELRKE